MSDGICIGCLHMQLDSDDEEEARQNIVKRFEVSSIPPRRGIVTEIDNTPTV